ncbi:hypothetical protein [Paenibacillus sp. HB172176]|uniref:hypothetical protein n=1 Tax=Paenibacillus sp. HB172176 TaxID=2493690 RepID=UPI00143B4381|nr:hypothetical protein [Paenibacillus sp. HB172176]
MRVLSLVSSLLLLLGLAACGQYSDDKMVGTINGLHLEENTVEVDISNWYKRDMHGAVDDYGVSIIIDYLDKVVIKNEAGTLLDRNQLKEGQKVRVDPPQGKKEKNYKAELITLLEMSDKEKYGQLLSRHKNLYNSAIFTGEKGEEGENLTQESEQRIMDSILSQSTASFGKYDPDYVVDYKKEFNIEQFPVMLVFDQKGLVFKTYDADELIAFFATK